MNGNVRADMLRQGGISQPPNMLGMANSPFMQSTGQGGQQLGHIGLPSTANNPNPPMGMLSANPANPMAAHQTSQRYLLQQQQASMQQQPPHRQMLMRGQNVQGLNPTVGSVSGSHMALNPSMGFPGNLMAQQAGGNVPVRRVSAQTQPNPVGHLANMPPGVPGSMAMNMNPQNSLPTHMRTHQMRMQMPPEAMGMSRQSSNPGMSRTNSAQAQAMNSLTQPPQLGSVPHPPGMQPSLHQNAFPNSASLPSQHQTPQLSSSPRPGSLPPNHTQNMAMATPGSSHTPVNRTRMSPENGNPMGFMNFQDPGFPQGNNRGMPSNGAQYNFTPSSSSPSLHMSDMSPIPSGLMNTANNNNRSGFQLTPAQAYGMTVPPEFGSNYGMPPPQNVPPRPPSHNNTHPPLPQQQLNQNMQHSPHRNSPIPQDQLPSNLQRPPSQPQSTPGRPPSQGPRTPRSSQPSLPSGTPLTASGRIPQPAHGQPQPMSVAGGQHLPIAPRPPQTSSVGPMTGVVATSSQSGADASPPMVPRVV